MAAKKQSPIVTVSLLGIACIGLFSLWDGAKKFEHYIGALPIQGAQTTVQAKIEGAEKASSLAVLYPLYVESQQKAERLPHSPEESARAIDSSFVRSDSTPTTSGAAAGMPVPEPVALPDYFTLLNQAVKVEAVMENGAVLSGRFYALGEPVETFAYPAKNGRGTTVPVLTEVGADFVVLQEGSGEGARTISVKAPRRQ
jgi:hypothetical protein